MSVPARQIRARYSSDTITVYQAYPPQVALPAVAAGRFVAPFKRDRMTRIFSAPTTGAVGALLYAVVVAAGR